MLRPPLATTRPMTTRRCSRCASEKTIRGVWYLAPATGPTAFFVCESCYVTSGGAPVTS